MSQASNLDNCTDELRELGWMDLTEQKDLARHLRVIKYMCEEALEHIHPSVRLIDTIHLESR